MKNTFYLLVLIILLLSSLSLIINEISQKEELLVETDITISPLEETLNEIRRIEKEITEIEQLTNNEILNLKKINPLFAAKDSFEDNSSYKARIKKGDNLIEEIKKRNQRTINKLLSNIITIKETLFETENITLELKEHEYDADLGIWKIKIILEEYHKKEIKIDLKVHHTTAASLFENKENLHTKCLFTIGKYNEIILVSIYLNNPAIGFEYFDSFPYDVKEIRENYNQSLAFSPDGNLLAIRTYFGLEIYRLDTRTKVKSLESFDIESFAFSSDGKNLAVGLGKYKKHRVSIIDIKTEKEEITFMHELKVNSIAFSSDGKLIATGTGSDYNDNYDRGYARIFNAKTGKQYKVFKNKKVNSVALSPDGKLLAVGCHRGKNYIDKAITNLYNVETGKIFKKYMFKEDVDCVAFSPSGEFLAIGSGNSTMIYNVKTGQKVKSFTFKCIYCSVKSITFSPDGKYLAIGSSTSTMVYNLEKEIKVDEFDIPTNSIAFSPNGRYLVIGENKGSVTIYRTFYQEEDEIRVKNIISAPPLLTAKVTFAEPSGNKYLDANETGKFVLTIRNEGKGPGKGIFIKMNSKKNEHLSYSDTYIKEIAPNDSAIVQIPITADITTNDASHLFRFDFEERNGFPPAPVELEFSTKSYLKPEMFIVDIGIDDKSGNGMIESGEIIKLSVRVGNKGKGTSVGTKIKFYAGDDVFFTNDHIKTINIGNVEYNGQIDIPIEFFVNDKTKDDIPLYVDITEATNLATVHKLRLPIKKSERIKHIQKTIVAGIENIYDEPSFDYDLSIDVDNNLPKGKTIRKSDIAIVIGNKNYNKAKSVDFALRDATIIKKYLIESMGFKKGNIFFVQNATKGDFETLFGTKDNHKGKLFNMVKENKSDVFIYYSGHGAPSVKDQKGYFVPVECDPQYVELGGYSLETFYNNLANIPAKSFTIVLDACFSGTELLNNISPMVLKVENPVINIKDAIILTSSRADQASCWYNEKKHGMLTYFFLKGIHNKNADTNNNNELTFSELYKYISDNNDGVPYYSRKIHGIEQNPQILGKNKNKVFFTY